eukprot:EG_transcript_15366
MTEAQIRECLTAKLAAVAHYKHETLQWCAAEDELDTAEEERAEIAKCRRADQLRIVLAAYEVHRQRVRRAIATAERRADVFAQQRVTGPSLLRRTQANEEAERLYLEGIEWDRRAVVLASALEDVAVSFNLQVAARQERRARRAVRCAEAQQRHNLKQAACLDFILRQGLGLPNARPTPLTQLSLASSPPSLRPLGHSAAPTPSSVLSSRPHGTTGGGGPEMPPRLTSAAPFPSGRESPTRRRLFTPTSPTAALSPPSPSSAPSSVPGSLPATPSQPQMPTDLDPVPPPDRSPLPFPTAPRQPPVPPAGNSQPAMPADPSPQRPSNRVLRQPLATGAAVYRNS